MVYHVPGMASPAGLTSAIPSASLTQLRQQTAASIDIYVFTFFCVTAVSALLFFLIIKVLRT